MRWHAVILLVGLGCAASLALPLWVSRSEDRGPFGGFTTYRTSRGEIWRGAERRGYAAVLFLGLDAARTEIVPTWPDQFALRPLPAWYTNAEGAAGPTLTIPQGRMLEGFGWPRPSLARTLVGEPGPGWRALGQASAPPVQRPGIRFTLLGLPYPTRILWVGMLFNAGLFSLMLLTPYALLIAARKGLRRTLGRCVSCGYQLLPGQSPCPECGQPAPGAPRGLGR